MTGQGVIERQCGNCGVTDTGKFCSHCGCEMAQRGAVARLMLFALGPIADYGAALKLSFDPAELVRRVRSGEQTAEACSKAILTGILICGIWDYLAKRPSEMFDDTPVLGDLRNLALGFTILLSAYPLHRILVKTSQGASLVQALKAELISLRRRRSWQNWRSSARIF